MLMTPEAISLDDELYVLISCYESILEEIS